MHDHFSWLIQNLLPVILSILGEANVSVHAKTQVGEIFISIFDEEGNNAAACFRTFVEENEDCLDMLSKSALDGLARIGHYELQELVLEFIVRMWRTKIRNRKALKWFEGYPKILAKFLAIGYDEFDYTVRMFLNEVNSSVRKRRIVTVQYEKLVIGEETYLPTNRWYNCADFCFESKVLDVRYPYHEGDSQNKHKCKWIGGHVKADDLASFKIEDNKSSGAYELHLNFRLPAYRVMYDFTMEDKVSRKMIVMICRQERLTLAKLVKIANTLFGETRNLSSNDDFVTSQAEPETVKGSRASESVPNAEISVSLVLVSGDVHQAPRSGSDDNANQETPFRPSEVTISNMTMTNSRSIVHTVGSDSDAIRGATSEEFSNSKRKQTTKKKNQSHEKDRADEVVPEKTSRRKRKAVTPLPYEAFEEVPVIDMSPVVVLPSIETVRDAPRDVTTRAGLEKCEKNMRELVSLQDEAVESMETMKTRLEDALTRTAKSILETKKAFKSSMTVVEEAYRRGEEVTNRLGHALSPRMGEEVERENVAGERQEVM